MTPKEATARIETPLLSDATIAKIAKQFGAGSLVRMGEKKYAPAEVISTGLISLDRAIRPSPLGGFPKGRIVELFGQEATGKTSIALSVVAQAQKAGGLCAYVDAEHAIDRDHARRLGVDVDNLYVHQPSCGEEGLEMTDSLVSSKEVAVVVVDSVSALVPRAELEGEMGDPTMALQARLMNSALRKLTGSVANSKCVLIFINQLRDRIGVFYGNPTTTTGGKGLKFSATLRLELKRVGAIKEGERDVGVKTKIVVVKNKIGAPAAYAEIDLLFDRGFSKEGDLLDLCTENGLASKTGAWISVGEDRFQGRDNAVEWLRENPELAAKLEKEIRAKLC